MCAAVYLHSRVQLFATPWTVSPPVCSVHGDSPGKNARVGCHALLQGIFLTQRWNSHLPPLLHCRRILYHWVKLDLLYMKLTLIMKIPNQWKTKMEKPKEEFIFNQLIIRQITFISICLCLFFQLIFHWRIITFQNFKISYNVSAESEFPNFLFIWEYLLLLCFWRTIFLDAVLNFTS